MRKVLLFLCVLVSGFSVFGQNTTFDNLTANYGRSKSITWFSSNYGSGFGHRILNTDPGGQTLLNFQGRHNSSTWSDILTLTSNGNVGIGTTNPQAKLEVSSANSGDAILRIEADEDNNNEADNPLIQFRQDGGQLGINLGFSEENFGGNIFGIGTRYSGQESWDTFVVNTQNGNIGIGTNSPQAGLHIANNTGLFIDDTVSGFPGRISMTDGFTNASTKDDMLFESDGAFIFKLDRNGNGISNLPGFGVYNKNNEAIFFAKDNGKVGIGTNTPDAKLAVNGNIHTKEVKVDLIGWADYVFKEDYKLPTLEQVEDHISEKGHLINIPSAAEVAENGIQLGEMNAKLLEKIEELTLYTIAQEKKLKEQEERLKKLETLLVKK
ncbi:tail fiber protein [uncultured Aquimarina sp.]|uniref:tail fiber protein n=1 Tax=uncultured Aquimarina sp. TaxID=575652 RepID=UPI002609962B|nr:tail fiber protein [uncultured Aquimarina sp.]